MERSKFAIVPLKKNKSITSDISSPLNQKPVPLIEPKQEPIKVKKVRLMRELDNIGELTRKKMSNMERSINFYYEGKSKGYHTVHPCLEKYEKAKVERFQVMEVRNELIIEKSKESRRFDI